MNNARTEKNGLSQNERLKLSQKPNIPTKSRKSSRANVIEGKSLTLNGIYQDHYDKQSKMEFSSTSLLNTNEDNEFNDYDEPLTPARPVPGRSNLFLLPYEHVTIAPERITKSTEIL